MWGRALVVVGCCAAPAAAALDMTVKVNGVTMPTWTIDLSDFEWVAGVQSLVSWPEYYNGSTGFNLGQEVVANSAASAPEEIIIDCISGATCDVHFLQFNCKPASDSTTGGEIEINPLPSDNPPGPTWCVRYANMAPHFTVEGNLNGNGDPIQYPMKVYRAQMLAGDTVKVNISTDATYTFIVGFEGAVGADTFCAPPSGNGTGCALSAPTVPGTDPTSAPATGAPTGAPAASPVSPAPTGTPATASPTAAPGTILNSTSIETLRSHCEAWITTQNGLAPQWLRAAFHDAGAWDGDTCEGGARGCLFWLRDTCAEHAGLGSNLSLQTGFDPIDAILEVQTAMQGSTGITLSIADLIQGCGAAAVDWASEPHSQGTLLEKLLWGRPDANETECPASICDKLPGFHEAAAPACFPGPCRDADLEATAAMINTKMGAGGNGFDIDEIVALVGAHSIGQTRNQFPGMDAPWTKMPLEVGSFGNDYFKLLKRVSDEHTSSPFDQAPFEADFHTWWQDSDQNVCNSTENTAGLCSPELLMLDADVALQHDTTLGFGAVVDSFASDSELFHETFHSAYVKMSQIGLGACTPVSTNTSAPVSFPFSAVILVNWEDLFPASTAAPASHGNLRRLLQSQGETFLMSDLFAQLKSQVRQVTVTRNGENVALSTLMEGDIKFKRACPMFAKADGIGRPNSAKCVTDIAVFAQVQTDSTTSASSQIELEIPIKRQSGQRNAVSKIGEQVKDNVESFIHAGKSITSGNGQVNVTHASGAMFAGECPQGECRCKKTSTSNAKRGTPRVCSQRYHET